LGRQVLAGLLTAWLVLPGFRAAHAAPADLDPGFGTGGKVSTGFGGTSDLAAALVLQPDGKLVAAGYMNSGGTLNFALARYNPSGSLDLTFGTGGKVTTDFGGSEVVIAIVRQPDGKLVAAGYSSGNFALARYNPSGSLDLTFGTGGKVTTDFDGTDFAYALVLQPDGKLVAGGFSDSNFALARYNASGGLDLTFGTGGKVTTDFGGTDWATALVLQPDGKLVAGGFSDSNFALARYNPSGSLDLTFGGSTGKVTTDFGGPDDLVSDLMIQPDGKLVAAGNSSGNFALARYNPSGSLDLTFGGSTGKVTTDFGGPDDLVSALVIQPDGKLVAAGRSLDNFALARYNPNGSLDLTFGTGGKVTTDFGGPDDLVSALVIQPDGKLVAAGVSSANFALARYQGGGTAATRMLTMFKVGTNSGPEGSEQRTFLTTDPIIAGAAYYDPAEACAGIAPATLKFFVFNLEGQLILGRDRVTTGGVDSAPDDAMPKYQALVALLAPGALPPGDYNLVFRVQDCTSADILVSEFYTIQVLAAP
jgi:uncharacterized delta-60 repeat protein